MLVARSKTHEGTYSYGLHLLNVFSYEGEDIVWTAKLCVPSMVRQFGTVCINYVKLEAFKGRPDISSVMDNDEHHPVLL